MVTGRLILLRRMPLGSEKQFRMSWSFLTPGLPQHVAFSEQKALELVIWLLSQ